MARAEFRITHDGLTADLNYLKPKIKRALDNILEYWGARGASEMRAGAHWIDDTGNARAGLQHKIFKSEESVSIVYYGAMHYNIWLEIRWSGRYAIIGPVRASVIPRLRDMMTDILNRL